MAIKSSSFEDELLVSLTDPEEAAAYLGAAIRDSRDSFLEAMSDVAKAHKMANVAHKADVERASIYRMLSSAGNPTFDNLASILDVMGLTFNVIPKSRIEEIYAEERPEPVVAIKNGEQAFKTIKFKSQDQPNSPLTFLNNPLAILPPVIRGELNGYAN